jgi:ABC-type enterochelin transport system ATPase subunit
MSTFSTTSLPSKNEFESGFEAAIENNKYLARHYKELQKNYGDKVVAVSNGKVLCSGETTEEVLAKLEAEKIDLNTVLVEYIPEPGVIILF